MSQDKPYSQYQRDLIDRYYKRKDDIMVQKLGELISEIYVCESPKRLDRLWDRVGKALLNLEENPAFVKDLVDKRDLEFLAKVLNTLQ